MAFLVFLRVRTLDFVSGKRSYHRLPILKVASLLSNIYIYLKLFDFSVAVKADHVYRIIS